MSANAAIAKKLVELFLARFDPANTAEAEVKIPALTVEIEKALDSVENLDEDRILRRFLALIQATVRTNYFQKDAGGAPKPYFPSNLIRRWCRGCLSPNRCSKSTFTRRASRACI